MRFLAFVAISVCACALSAAAEARSDCAYAGGSKVVVYAGGGGVTGDALVGICGDAGAPFDGGYIEAGNGAKGTYAVADGSDANPAGQTQGYIGVSTYENGGKAPCPTGTSGGSGTNSGGCFTVVNPTNGAVIAIFPGMPLVCGDPFAPSLEADWANSGRDGCRIP